MAKIFVKDNEITVISIEGKDYISLTDIAKAKNPADANGVISNWLRNRNTIEYLGIWECLYNPNFKPLEFEGFLNEAGSNTFTINYVYADEADLLNVALFGKTAKKWRDENPNEKGNMRDYATLEQLVVLSNMESINALLIRQELPQSERLVQLNNVAITQMRSLLENKKMKSLK